MHVIMQTINENGIPNNQKIGSVPNYAFYTYQSMLNYLKKVAKKHFDDNDYRVIFKKHWLCPYIMQCKSKPICLFIE